MLLRKTLVNDRVAEDDCLLAFASWRDSPYVLMCMRDASCLGISLHKYSFWELYIVSDLINQTFSSTVKSIGKCGDKWVK